MNDPNHERRSVVSLKGDLVDYVRLLIDLRVLV